MENRTVTFIVAHPDDEVITCGRTLFTFARINNSINVLLATDHMLHDMEMSKKCIDIFHWVMKDAHANYKILNNAAYTLDHTDNSLIHCIRAVAKYSDIIITHHPNDFNRDHHELSKATILASRTLTKPKMLLFMDSYAPEKIRDFRGNCQFLTATKYENVHLPYIEQYDLAHDSESGIRYSNILKERNDKNEYFEIYSYREVLS